MDIEEMGKALQRRARLRKPFIAPGEIWTGGMTQDELCAEAATALSTLQAENEKLRSEAEGMRSNWYKSVEEIQKLRASPHGKIKDSTLQSICNRANEIACRPPEGEEDT